jgi:small subunit ribosomal protein S6
MEQNYELVVVTEASISDADRKSILDQVKKIIESEKGEVEHEDTWGKRTFAYPIKKTDEGHYTLMTFKGSSSTPQAIKGKFNLIEEILRYLVVRKEGERGKGKKKSGE